MFCVCALIAHQLVVDSGADQMWPDAVQRSQRTLDCLRQPEAVAQVTESVIQSHCSLLTVQWSLRSARCSVLTVQWSLRSAWCSVLTVCCSLLTALTHCSHCSLIAAHCRLMSYSPEASVYRVALRQLLWVYLAQSGSLQETLTASENSCKVRAPTGLTRLKSTTSSATSFAQSNATSSGIKAGSC